MRSWLADWLTDVGLWILKKGGTDMVAVYVALIINGRRTYASVPALLKDKVKVDLEALGLEDLCK